ncbi:putative sulfate exporter family transporter [Wenzhouxiangella sp. XN201]|uniref:putative sulfate exporter family transporter n=1 Tax=Wenzhouxiangella sp. XN201 TaxID=2710755 RepID=UPI0013C9204C|nr:putative sulfate exporter family transporter [Wenzhouxiangella sp. XN201]
MTETLRSRIPGLALAAVIAAGAWLIVRLIALLPPPVGSLPLSMMLVAILAGLALAAPVNRRPGLEPGLALARGIILKTAVALIGLRLSLADLGQLGAQAWPLVLLVVATGLLVTLLLARLAGAGPRLGILLAAGTSICGASAIAATAPGLKAKSDEICYAIACIALIGLTATVLYPWLLERLFESPEEIGFILGVAVHDTAQVTAAAALHEQAWDADGTLVAATVAKLMRNAGMLILIPALVWFYTRRHEGGSAKVRLPLFIVAFIALSGARSGIDALLGPDHALWNDILAVVAQASMFAFAMAMTALATTVQPSELKAHGWKPAVAAVAAAAVMFGVAVWWMN